MSLSPKLSPKETKSSLVDSIGKEKSIVAESISVLCNPPSDIPLKRNKSGSIIFLPVSGMDDPNGLGIRSIHASLSSMWLALSPGMKDAGDNGRDVGAVQANAGSGSAWAAVGVERKAGVSHGLMLPLAVPQLRLSSVLGLSSCVRASSVLALAAESAVDLWVITQKIRIGSM